VKVEVIVQEISTKQNTNIKPPNNIRQCTTHT